MATPEYMPPEILDMFKNKQKNIHYNENLDLITTPWSIDMWSVGAVLLEILTGLPHWLAYKCRVVDK
jgi:serine/threonine protein kinase